MPDPPWSGMKRVHLNCPFAAKKSRPVKMRRGRNVGPAGDASDRPGGVTGPGPWIASERRSILAAASAAPTAAAAAAPAAVAAAATSPAAAAVLPRLGLVDRQRPA